MKRADEKRAVGSRQSAVGAQEDINELIAFARQLRQISRDVEWIARRWQRDLDRLPTADCRLPASEGGAA